MNIYITNGQTTGQLTAEQLATWATGQQTTPEATRTGQLTTEQLELGKPTTSGQIGQLSANDDILLCVT